MLPLQKNVLGKPTLYELQSVRRTAIGNHVADIARQAFIDFDRNIRDRLGKIAGIEPE